MKTSYEHQKVIDFVDRFKEANKNTVHRVRKYDTKLKTWTFEVVKVDENAIKFSEDIKNSKRRQRERDKRQKANSTKVVHAPKKLPQKPKSIMRLNVVRLHNDGLKFKEIGKLYGVSESSAKTAYHREIHGI